MPAPANKVNCLSLEENLCSEHTTHNLPPGTTFKILHELMVPPWYLTESVSLNDTKFKIGFGPNASIHSSQASMRCINPACSLAQCASPSRKFWPGPTLPLTRTHYICPSVETSRFRTPVVHSFTILTLPPSQPSAANDTPEAALEQAPAPPFSHQGDTFQTDIFPWGGFSFLSFRPSHLSLSPPAHVARSPPFCGARSLPH